MTDRVPPCTAFRELPGLDAPRALSQAGNATHALWGDTFVHCVLGEHQGGEHAGPIGDQDDTPQTLWLLWTQTGYRLEWRASCGAESGSSTCWFHRNPSNSHAWQVAGPVREAIRTLLNRTTVPCRPLPPDTCSPTVNRGGLQLPAAIRLAGTAPPDRRAVKLTTTIEPEQDDAVTVTRYLSLDLTRKCQLACTHCYNESGPEGTHGTMTREDWLRALDQAAEFGVATAQMIGGEPTMHPDFRELVDHALKLGLEVEVFSNLVHVSAENWELYQRPGISLATSYYSDRAEVHNAVTGRPSHRKTRANIEKAVHLGVPLRVGIVTTGESDDGSAARADLEALGVTSIRIDRAREFGRGALGLEPDMANLCGRCGTSQRVVRDLLSGF